MRHQFYTLPLTLLFAVIFLLSACESGGSKSDANAADTEKKEVVIEHYWEAELIPGALKAKIPNFYQKMNETPIEAGPGQEPGLQVNFSKNGSRTIVIMTVKHNTLMPESKLGEWKDNTIAKHKQNPDFRKVNTDQLVELAGQKWVLIDLTMNSKDGGLILRQYGTGHNNQMLLVQLLYPEEELEDYKTHIQKLEESMTLLDEEA